MIPQTFLDVWQPMLLFLFFLLSLNNILFKFFAFLRYCRWTQSLPWALQIMNKQGVFDWNSLFSGALRGWVFLWSLPWQSLCVKGEWVSLKWQGCRFLCFVMVPNLKTKLLLYEIIPSSMVVIQLQYIGWGKVSFTEWKDILGLLQ